MKIIFTLFAAVLLTATTFAQVGINSENPDTSAVGQNMKPKYSVSLFNGAFVLEYDEIKLIENDTYQTTTYQDDKLVTFSEGFMVFQLLKSGTPIMEIEIIEKDGYFLDNYYFFDEDIDLQISKLKNENPAYFLKACKDIFLNHPIIQDQSIFNWSNLLKVKAFDAVNTPYNEYKPQLTGDGLTMFFLRSGAPDNSVTLPTRIIDILRDLGKDTPVHRKEALDILREETLAKNFKRSGEKRNENITFDTDILIYKMTNDGISGILHPDYPLNDWSADFFIGISSDGKKVYTKFKDLGTESKDLGFGSDSAFQSFMEFEVKKFYPYEFNNKILRFEKDHNVFSVSYFLTLNNNAILCGFQGDDTKGFGDIYISFKQENGLFEYPVNIGSDINTEQDEGSPFLAADLQTLYFSRKINNNERKIFVSRRLDETWKRWSKPIALPAPINIDGTFNSSPYVTADGKKLYFSSDRKKGKDQDIYFVYLDDLLAPIAAPLVQGKVYSKVKVLEDVQIEIQAIKQEETEKQDFSITSSNFDGTYEMPFRDGEATVIKASKKGYIAELVISKNPSEAKQDIEMHKLESGKRFTLNNILFKRGTAKFLKTAFLELENLKTVLVENPTIRILIEGHTDDGLGRPKPLLELSEKRAKAVKDFLILKKIAPSRISIKGFGGTKPAFSNTTENTRKKNRRVEIVIK